MEILVSSLGGGKKDVAHRKTPIQFTHVFSCRNRLLDLLRNHILAIAALAAIIGFGFLPLAKADLQPRLGGAAVYDTDLNVTWITNGNLAATNTFGTSAINSDGSMSWSTAQAWIQSMNNANYLGISTWRLPNTLAGDPSCNSTQGTISYNCTGSELGHLFYTELGGTIGKPISQAHSSNYSLFSNLQDTNDFGRYWSATTYAPDANSAWLMSFGQGGQTFDSKFQSHFVIALTSGDVGALTSYYFAHIAVGGPWRTTFTLLNGSAQTVNCTTFFYSDSGSALSLVFGGNSVSFTTDSIPPGGIARRQTDAQPSAATVTGWARADCNGAVKASSLFRSYNGSTPIAEGGVIAMSIPASRFVTYADQSTGLAWANPSPISASVTFTAKDSNGTVLSSTGFVVPSGNHGQANVGPLLRLGNFQGSITITSTVPIISLSLNFEAAPIFSALPPGQDP